MTHFLRRILSTRRPAAALLCAGLSGSSAIAQCANYWKPGFGIPGLNRTVYSTATWDPDGAGPATPVVVFGGTFDFAGDRPAAGVATWDPATGAWGTLGSGLNARFGLSVNTLIAMPNGDLIAGGDFIFPGGDAIARWDGSTWSSLASGPGGYVTSTALLPNGDLVVGGGLSNLGIVSRWDGTSWTSYGSNFNGLVWAVAVLANGDIVAGGAFTTAGGQPASRIARFDGTSWVPMGAGVNNTVRAIVQRPNGDVIATGSFSTAGQVAASRIARWNGTAWSPLGAGLSGTGHDLDNLPNGDLLVSGAFGSSGGILHVARWNGVLWSGYSAGVEGSAAYSTCQLPNGDLVTVGDFELTGTQQPALRAARWDGFAWRFLGSGMDKAVRGLAKRGSGRYVAVGNFGLAGTVAARQIAEWTGTAWASPGRDPGYQSLSAVATLSNGDIVAGGANGLTGPNIARFNGSVWANLGTGTNGTISAILPLPNDEIIVGGRFTVAGGVSANFVAQWNGTAWSPLGAGMNSGINAAITSFARLPNGHVVAGGFFNTAGNVAASNIAEWDGTNWTPLGTGMNLSVLALCTLPNGHLIAAGDFTTAGGVSANRIARWDGTSWSPLGTGLDGSATAVTALPNGDVVVAGSFITAGGVAVDRLARWNGTAWSPIDAQFLTAIALNALLTLPDGDVVLGGDFLSPGAAHVKRLSTTCPATATDYGTGCASSVGLMTLTAADLPWVGGTLRTTCSSIAAQGAVVLGVLGVTNPALPLSLLHPAGGAGCSLLATLDVTLFLAPASGTATMAVGIPLDTSLVGVALRHQALQLELDQQFNIVLFTGSNGLLLTLGMF